MHKLSSFCVITAGVLWGIIGIFVRRLSGMGFGSVQISALRWIFAGITVLAVMLIFDRKKLKINIKDVGYFIGTGVFSTLACSTCYFVSMRLTSIPVADILMYTAPVWVMFASVFMFGETFSAQKLVCVALTFTGTVFASGFISRAAAPVNLPGVAIGLCSGAAFGLYSILGSWLIKKYEPITVTVYTFVFTAAGSVFLINVPQTAALLINQPKAVLDVCALAVISTIGAYGLYTAGLKYMPASRAAILSCVEPVTSVIVGVYMAKQPFTLYQLMGIVMILSAVVLLQLKSLKRK